MGKLSPLKIEKLVNQGRLVPLIERKEDGNFYLVGYTRKKTSRKNDRIMLPEPQMLQVPQKK